MFWHLLLAHLIADYPLQPSWMVRNKIRPRVLLLHAAVHFLVVLVVLLPASAQWWPYLLAIAAAHFLIDTGKNWFTIHRPGWVVGPYLVDQACHVLSIILVNLWASGQVAAAEPYLDDRLVMIAIGFLLVTYVYLVTERVFTSITPLARFGTDVQAWERMFIRAVLLAVLLLAWDARSAALAGLTVLLPYQATRSGLRVLLIDLIVTLCTA
ncbi:MAG: DUF3307 domain-containing protein, partial [Chloroflexi bacterium]